MAYNTYTVSYTYDPAGNVIQKQIQAPQPVLQVDSTVLPFGNVNIGQAAGLTLTLTNAGSGGLTVISIALEGGSAASTFCLAPGTCPTLTAILAGSAS